MTYAMLNKDDTLPQPFYQVQDMASAKSYREENEQSFFMMLRRQYNLAAQQQRTSRMLNRVAMKVIDVPLYAKNDTLVIFDYENKTIWYFDKKGQELGSGPILFDVDGLMRMRVIKDPITQLFYVYNYQGHAQSLQRVNLNEPGSIATISLEKPFAENVKVYNGDIYYLWQDGRNAATRQLYVQKGFY